MLQFFSLIFDGLGSVSGILSNDFHGVGIGPLSKILAVKCSHLYQMKTLSIFLQKGFQLIMVSSYRSESDRFNGFRVTVKK